MRCDGVARAIEVWGQEREDDEVWMAMDLYPITINEDLIACKRTPDDVDDMGDTAAALFGRSVAPVNLEAHYYRNGF